MKNILNPKINRRETVRLFVPRSCVMSSLTGSCVMTICRSLSRKLFVFDPLRNDRIATHVLAFEGNSHVEWFEGNFQDYEKHKMRPAGRRRNVRSAPWIWLAARTARWGATPKRNAIISRRSKSRRTEPSVLSNLGLSYALSKDLNKAEQTLRRAAAQQPADPRVRQNLALVVGLQGRFAEA